jgi:hypothetical protein
MVRVCHWHVGVMVKMIVPMALMNKIVVRFLQAVLAIYYDHLGLDCDYYHYNRQ